MAIEYKLSNTAAEIDSKLAKLDGVTSNVQTQLDEKMDKNNPAGTGSFSMNRKAGTTVGEYSTAEGYDTEASGWVSYAEGQDTISSGSCSHTEGFGSAASGDYSHAEGYSTEAVGASSHAEGTDTVASGNNSHAEGYQTEAIGESSHAGGRRTIAAAPYQTAIGKYNIMDGGDEYALIVGNGNSGSNRSNAHTLSWNGNAWFAGTVADGYGHMLSNKVDNAVINTELWSGSWSSGDIEVPNTSNYHLYQVTLKGQGTSILAIRRGSYIRGIGGYPTSAATSIHAFAATFSGNTWSFVRANVVAHTASGNHSAVETFAVESIRGII